MKMTDCENDREKVPLMKELHEVGLKHGVQMVVVAIPMSKEAGGVRTFLIDHKEDTTPRDVATKFVGAGVFLIQVAGAAEDYACEQAETQDVPK